MSDDDEPASSSSVKKDDSKSSSSVKGKSSDSKDSSKDEDSKSSSSVKGKSSDSKDSSKDEDSKSSSSEKGKSSESKDSSKDDDSKSSSSEKVTSSDSKDDDSKSSSSKESVPVESVEIKCEGCIVDGKTYLGHTVKDAKLIAVVTPKNADATVKWSSDDIDVLDVDEETGELKPKKGSEDAVKITAECGGKTATFMVNVETAIEKLSMSESDKVSIMDEKDAKFKIGQLGMGPRALAKHNVKFSISSDSKSYGVILLDENGKQIAWNTEYTLATTYAANSDWYANLYLKGTGKGEETLTITATAKDKYGTHTVSKTVKVYEASTKMTAGGMSTVDENGDLGEKFYYYYANPVGAKEQINIKLADGSLKEHPEDAKFNWDGSFEFDNWGYDKRIVSVKNLGADPEPKEVKLPVWIYALPMDVKKLVDDLRASIDGYVYSNIADGKKNLRFDGESVVTLADISKAVIGDTKCSAIKNECYMDDANNIIYFADFTVDLENEKLTVGRQMIDSRKPAHIYSATKVGDVIWSAENLVYQAKDDAVCRVDDGATTDFDKCSKANEYFYLADNTSDKVCPDGDWRLPTLAELKAAIAEFVKFEKLGYYNDKSAVIEDLDASYIILKEGVYKIGKDDKVVKVSNTDNLYAPVRCVKDFK